MHSNKKKKMYIYARHGGTRKICPIHFPICNGKTLHGIEHTKWIKQGWDCQRDNKEKFNY